MKVECPWVTCLFNSENKWYKSRNKEFKESGICECFTGIINLSSNVECDYCKDTVDALVCKDYVGNY